MRQQINLLRDEFKPRNLLFSTKNLGYLASFVVMAVVVQLWLEMGTIDTLTVERDLARDRQNTVVAALTKRQKEVNESFVEKEVDELIARMEQDLVQKQQLKNRMTSAMSASNQRFSPYFLAFSRNHKPEVWLENVYFGGENQLSIKGFALSSRALTHYIDRLSGDPLFDGKRIDLFKLEKVNYQLPASADVATGGSPGAENGASEAGKHQYFSFELSAGVTNKAAPVMSGLN